jgi:signal transduction histidine kinase/CheY-like chemotaxis protein
MPDRRDEDITGDVMSPSKILSLRGDVPWPVPRSKNSFYSDPGSAEIGEKLEHEQPSVGVSESSVALPEDAGSAEASLASATAIHDSARSLPPAVKPTRSPADSVSTRDQVSTNFQRASRILRQAMDLDGVVFIRAVPDNFAPDRQCTGKIAKKLGCSVRENPDLKNDVEAPDQFSVPEALHRSLLATYPRGHVFVFDADGSIKDYTHSHAPMDLGDSGNPMSSTGKLRAKSEASNRNEIDSVILANFPAARSMIFMPLWDLHKNQWFAGCIAWTTDVKRVLSSKEFGYFSAFGNSIMAEVARLELLATDLAKSDFISSISHELRSPLHGVLGSAELLRGMNLSDEQSQMMEMIETCGRTLLDTMEHILEYSKINSLKVGNSAFQKTRPATQGDNSDATDTHPRSEFDLSMLVEDTVEGTMAGHRFNVRSDASLNHWNRSTSPGKAHLDPATGLTQHPDVILNIENSTNWIIKSDVGAWRRILLNLLGNALKYTASGFIEVALGSSAGDIPSNHESTTDVSLIVRDTGRGISQEYLQNHLCKPFMQEDTFSVGAGLGLSIVNKLVAGLGGRISLNSEVGMGTEVIVDVPISSSPRPSLSAQRLLHWPNTRKLCLLTSNQDAQLDSTSMQGRSAKSNSATALMNALTIQAEQWFNLKVYPAHIITDVTAAIVVLLESDTHLLEDKADNNTTSTLLLEDVFLIILCSSVPTEMPPNLQGRANIQWLSQPIGPRKLARALANCFSESESGSAISMGSPARLQESTNGVGETLPTRRNEQQDQTALSNPEIFPNGAEAPSNGTGASGSGLHGQINGPSKTLYQDPSNPPDLPGTRVIQKPHLLLVDDNEINLKMLVVYMERLHCSYATATNGQQALEKYRASEQTFDYVLMDISMPIMDGFESTRQIRRFEREAGRTPSMIVALTGLGSGEAQREAFRSGVDMFLSKPVPMLKLKGIVEGRER